MRTNFKVFSITVWTDGNHPAIQSDSFATTGVHCTVYTQQLKTISRTCILFFIFSKEIRIFSMFVRALQAFSALLFETLFSVPNVGGPQIANPQICRLIIFYIWGPSVNVTLSGFAINGPNLFCDLRTWNFCKSAKTYFFSLQISHITLQLKFVHNKKSSKRRLLLLFLNRVVQYFVEISKLRFAD